MTTPLERIEQDVNSTLDLFERLRNAKTEIAHMRRHNLHVTASIQRDEIMARLEAWLDPDAGIIKMEQLTAQRELAAASARNIDPFCGF